MGLFLERGFVSATEQAERAITRVCMEINTRKNYYCKCDSPRQACGRVALLDMFGLDSAYALNGSQKKAAPGWPAAD